MPRSRQSVLLLSPLLLKDFLLYPQRSSHTGLSLTLNYTEHVPPSGLGMACPSTQNACLLTSMGFCSFFSFQFKCYLLRNTSSESSMSSFLHSSPKCSISAPNMFLPLYSPLTEITVFIYLQIHGRSPH